MLQEHDKSSLTQKSQIHIFFFAHTTKHIMSLKFTSFKLTNEHMPEIEQ